MRLNGWQRIGIVLSVVWILSVGGRGALEYLQGSGEPYYAMRFLPALGEDYYFADSIQIPVPPPKDTHVGSFVTFEEARGFRIEHHFRIGYLVAAVFAPVVLLWLFAYLSVFVVRWVRAGFKRNDT
jgi:hypothetical protein